MLRTRLFISSIAVLLYGGQVSSAFERPDPLLASIESTSPDTYDFLVQELQVGEFDLASQQDIQSISEILDSGNLAERRQLISMLHAEARFLLENQNYEQIRFWTEQLLDDDEPLVRAAAIATLPNFTDSDDGFNGLFSSESNRIIRLIETALTDPSDRVRSSAVRALGRLGYLSKSNYTQLAARLRDESSVVVLTAILVMQSLDARFSSGLQITESEREFRISMRPYLIKHLTPVLNNKNHRIRLHASVTILTISPNNKRATDALMTLIESSPLATKSEAYSRTLSLKLFEPTAIPRAVDLLRKRLFFSPGAYDLLNSFSFSTEDDLQTALPFLNDTDLYVRSTVAGSLAKKGIPQSLPYVLKSTYDTSTDTCIKSWMGLKEIGIWHEEIPAALTAAFESNSDIVRLAAIVCIDSFGDDAVGVLPIVRVAIADPSPDVRLVAARVIGEIEPSHFLAISTIHNAMAREDDSDAKDSLNATLQTRLLEILDQVEIMSQNELSDTEDMIKQFPQTGLMGIRVIETIKRERRSRLLNWIGSQTGALANLVRNTPIAWPFIGWIFMFLFCWIATFIFPNGIAQASDAIDRLDADAKLVVHLPLRNALVVGLFRDDKRVLDAWTKRFLPQANAKFCSLQTVSMRESYMPVPILVDNQLEEAFECSQVVHDMCQHSNSFITIVGVGGCGKTSLALQIGKKALEINRKPIIPILIEDEKQLDDFFGKVQHEVASLAKAPVSREMVLRLIENRNILIIVDHFTEMTRESQLEVQNALSRIACGMVIVTGREDEFERERSLQLRPSLLDKRLISAFIDKYTEGIQSGPHFEACARFSKVIGTHPVTPLIVKLFTEQVDPNAIGHDGEPKCVPEVFLNYVRRTTPVARP